MSAIVSLSIPSQKASMWDLWKVWIPAVGHTWRLREQEENNAWNRLDCPAGLVPGGCVTDLESQPILGLLPQRRDGFTACDRSHFVAARQDLVKGCCNV